MVQAIPLCRTGYSPYTACIFVTLVLCDVYDTSLNLDLGSSNAEAQGIMIAEEVLELEY